MRGGRRRVEGRAIPGLQPRRQPRGEGPVETQVGDGFADNGLPCIMGEQKPLDRLCAYFVSFVSFVVNIIIVLVNIFKMPIRIFTTKITKRTKNSRKRLNEAGPDGPGRAGTRAHEPTGGGQHRGSPREES